VESYECAVSLCQGYMAKVDDTSLQHLVPSTLRENPSVLFTNIAEIHDFHAGQVTLCSLPAVLLM